MKKPLLYIIGLLVLLGLIFILLPKNTSENVDVPKNAILFEGDGCPHCKIVNDFIVANNVKSKIQFETQEVFNNEANAAVMAKVWRACGLSNSKGMGVPLYWDGSTCYRGDQEVINYFKTKL